MKLAIRLITFLVIGLCVGAMLAQQPKTAKPPAIPDALQARFWKAQTQLKNAQDAARSAEEQSQQVVKEIQAACGAEFQPQMNPQGDPVCVAKPAEKPKK